MFRSESLAPGLLAAALLMAPPVRAQDREAVRTTFQEPVYPEDLKKEGKQGNVLLIGRIDAQGHLQELRAIAASQKEFVQPAVEAVRSWQFKPAMRDGKPIEIFANIGVRFRLQGDKHGQIGIPVLGDIAIFPADASGKKTAPEGFPVRRGQDPALRVEALLDLSPAPQDRTLTVKVEAESPKKKRIPVFQPPVAVPANVGEVRIPVVVNVGTDWEEGVWLLRFAVNGAGAGGGQFWLASDPAHYKFVIPKP